MGHAAHDTLHLRLGIAIGLLPLGILQLIADTLPVDILYILADDLVLLGNLVHLVFHLTAAFCHAVQKPFGYSVLHTVEVILEGSIHEVPGERAVP